MLGLLATDVRYIWQEIGLEMTTSNATMTKLQLSRGESRYPWNHYCSHYYNCLSLSQMFSCHSLYIATLQKQKAHLRLPELYCSYKNAVRDHP